jgi:hypothetical protein
MSYSPLQARDRHGRWIAKGGNRAFKIASKSVGAGTRVAAPKKRGGSQGRSTRPTGFKGLKRSTIPYARVNKRSQTVGVNAGTIIPGTKKRIVGGAYLRVESTTRHTTADRVAGKAVKSVFPKGTRRGKAAGFLRKNLSVNNPAIRGTTPKGNSIRLGTSRGAGPTVIVRRGRHKTSQSKSVAGVQRYNNRIAAVKGKRIGAKKGRPARRKAAKRGR